MSEPKVSDALRKIAAPQIDSSTIRRVLAARALPLAERMEAEIERLHADLEQERASAFQIFEMLRVERESIKKALWRYGRHAENCDVERLRDPTRTCNCGLSAALGAALHPKEPASEGKVGGI